MSTDRSIPFGRPWITAEDRAAVLRVLEGPILAHGPECKGFEEEFSEFIGLDCHAVAVSSCMAALHLSYLALGIGAGHEVIVPAQTHVATVNAVEAVQAVPIFADCDPRTGNLTAAAVEPLVTERTRAISVVHFVGIPCDMDEILAVADQHHLRVIEDCALALGARASGRHVGMMGDAGCFSFYPVKHITTGEGGMFITRHGELARVVAQLRAHGVDRSHSERSIPGLYDVSAAGLNYRMSEMQGALGRQQLCRIDEVLARREANFLRLSSRLQSLECLQVIDSVASRTRSSHYCLSLVLQGGLGPRRNYFAQRLNALQVGTSIHYPHPVPRLQYYREKYGHTGEEFPCATIISDHSVALPVGPHVTASDADYIADCVERVLKETTTA